MIQKLYKNKYLMKKNNKKNKNIHYNSKKPKHSKKILLQNK